MRQGKAPRAGNSHSIAKRGNAALARLGGSLRARREAAQANYTLLTGNNRSVCREFGYRRLPAPRAHRHL